MTSTTRRVCRPTTLFHLKKLPMLLVLFALLSLLPTSVLSLYEKYGITNLYPMQNDPVEAGGGPNSIVVNLPGRIVQAIRKPRASDLDSKYFWIISKHGIVKQVPGTSTGNGADVTTILDLKISGDVDDRGEMGLIGITFDPNYLENGYFYLHYQSPKQASLYNTDDKGEINGNMYEVLTGSDNDPWCRISRFQYIEGNTPAQTLNTKIEIINWPTGLSNHKGGYIDFYDEENLGRPYLYIVGGDGGIYQTGEDRWWTLLGKVLRIDVLNPTLPMNSGTNGIWTQSNIGPDITYTIPIENPFWEYQDIPYVGPMTANTNPPPNRMEIYAFGIRNMWRCNRDYNFDTGVGTGRLFCGDVQGSLAEEISIITKGSNQGWFHWEGYVCNDPPFVSSAEKDCSNIQYPFNIVDTKPIFNLCHTQYTSIISNQYTTSEQTWVSNICHPDTRLRGNVIIGGYVYNGSNQNARGNYFFTSFITNMVSRLVENPSNPGQWCIRPMFDTILEDWEESASAFTTDENSGLPKAAAFAEGWDNELYLIGWYDGDGITARSDNLNFWKLPIEDLGEFDFTGDACFQSNPCEYGNLKGIVNEDIDIQTEVSQQCDIPISPTFPPAPTESPTIGPTYPPPPQVCEATRCHDPFNIPKLQWTYDSINDVYSAELTFDAMEYTTTDGKRTVTRGYNCMLPGPLIEMEAGKTYNLRLINNLDTALWTQKMSPSPNNYNGYFEGLVTNLHTHGLHVSGVAPSDDPSIRIEPNGGIFDYIYTIPEVHMGGLHWYHPHHHGASTLQTGAGAIGLINILDQEPLPDTWPTNMKQAYLQVTEMDVLRTKDVAKQSDDNLYYSDHTELYYLINGCASGELDISVNQNEWTRFRISYVGHEHNVVMGINPTSGLESDQCLVKLLALDGVYLNEVPRNVPNGNRMLFTMSSRVDVAVKCNSVGQHSLGIVRADRNPDTYPWTELATISVNGPDVGHSDILPIWTPVRPDYLEDLRNVVPDEQDTLVMRTAGLNAVPYAGFSQDYIWEYSLGTIAEWGVEISDRHPFHLHINHMQISYLIDDNEAWGGYHGGMYGWYQEGDWVDTVSMAQNGLVRVPFKRFIGKHIMHCHVLHHADKDGMVRVMNIREPLDSSTCCGDTTGIGCDDDAVGQACCSANIVFEESRYDLTCANGGLGCNAGGFELCRFCGGGVFPECTPIVTMEPTSPTTSIPITSPPTASPTASALPDDTAAPSSSINEVVGNPTPAPLLTTPSPSKSSPATRLPTRSPTEPPRSLRPIAEPTQNAPGGPFALSPSQPVDLDVNDAQSNSVARRGLGVGSGIIVVVCAALLTVLC